MSYSDEVRITGVRMAHSVTLLTGSVRHIESVTDGSSWLPVSDVISYIERGRRFYVQSSDGSRAYVHVVPMSLRGRAYIRTKRDETITDNLLSLPGGPYQMTLLSSMLGLSGSGLR